MIRLVAVITPQFIFITELFATTCLLIRVVLGLRLTNAEVSMLGLPIMTDNLVSSFLISLYTSMIDDSDFSLKIQLRT